MLVCVSPRLAQGLLDAAFVVANVVEERAGNLTAVDQRLDHVHERRAHRAIARHEAGFEQRLPLPVFGPSFVVGAAAGQRARQRAETSFRPQPHIHAKDVSLRGLVAQGADNMFSQPRQVNGRFDCTLVL